MSLNFGSNTHAKIRHRRTNSFTVMSILIVSFLPLCTVLLKHMFACHKDALINIGKGSVGLGLSAAHCERISTKGICQIASGIAVSEATAPGRVKREAQLSC